MARGIVLISTSLYDDSGYRRRGESNLGLALCVRV